LLLEHLCKSECFDLKSFPFKSQLVYLLDACQRNRLSLLAQHCTELVLLHRARSLTVDHQSERLATGQRFIGSHPQLALSKVDLLLKLFLVLQLLVNLVFVVALIFIFTH